MQRIERYGVIALVFLLVTIVAVSLWGERKKSDGWFSFLDRDSKSARIDELLAEASTEPAPGSEPVAARDLVDGSAPLSSTEWSPVGRTANRGPEAPPAYFDEFGVSERDSSIVPETLDASLDYTPSAGAGTAAEPQPLAAPQPALAREYTIRRGDTLSEIALRELGTQSRWRELLELNPGLDPVRLREGTKIRTGGAPRAATTSGGGAPAAPQVVEAPKVAASGASYTIRNGDTLSAIAQRELGSSQRWRDLVELNPGLDPARLHVGTKIRLPGGAAAATAPRETRETRVARAEPTAPATPRRSKVR